MSSERPPYLIEGAIDISALLDAFNQFQSALPLAKSDLEKAGALQYFEFTFELLWKTLRRLLSARGKIVNSPKATLREAALEGLVDDAELWFAIIEDRNETVHTYNKDVAQDIFSRMPLFSTEAKKVIDKLKNLKKA